MHDGICLRWELKQEVAASLFALRLSKQPLLSSPPAGRVEVAALFVLVALKLRRCILVAVLIKRPAMRSGTLSSVVPLSSSSTSSRFFSELWLNFFFKTLNLN